MVKRVSIIFFSTFLFANPPKRLYFGRLAKLEYAKKFEGKLVKMKGYMLPFTDVRAGKTFILMQNPLSDEHDPLPPPNKLVLVESKKEIPATKKRMEVIGIFHIRGKLDPILGKTFYVIEAKSIRSLY